VLLVAYILPVMFLAEQLAHPIDYLIETLRVPAPLGGVIITMLVATPEAIGATRAALVNSVQRSINIFLGSVFSTIGADGTDHAGDQLFNPPRSLSRACRRQ
jgi:Ca2+:H+ antiporter